MKTVLVNLNSKYIHSSLAPWYLFAAVRNHDSAADIRVLEGTINEKNPDILERIIAEKADVLGFCCYIWNIEKVIQLAEYIKADNPDIKIFFGGPEVSYCPEDILEKYPYVDGVLCGEGEWIIPPLLDALKKEESIKGIPGVCTRVEDKIYINEPYVSEEVPPDPYTDEYLKSLNGRIAYFESSRGCPFSCAFCLSGRCGAVRYFPLEESRKALIKLANAGTRTIKFVDRTFNAHHERTNKWLSFLMKEWGVSIPKGVCFHFEVAGDLLKEDTLELMSRLPVGMIQLEIGLQSFNEDTLQAVTRKTDTLRLKENIRKLLSFENMHIHLDLIMGLPFEDMEKVRKSFIEAFSLRPHMLQVGFLKLLHGAAMREDAGKYPCEYDSRAPYQVISTPWLKNTELKALADLEDCVERIYNSGRLIKTLDYVLTATGMESFDFFLYISRQMKSFIRPGISYNEYQEVLYNILKNTEGVDAAVLRDVMVVDRLETDASGRLPSFLRIEDDNLRSLKKKLNKNEATAALPGVKRAVAILYTENKGIYADYVDKHPITGRYTLNYIDL